MIDYAALTKPTHHGIRERERLEAMSPPEFEQMLRQNTKALVAIHEKLTEQRSTITVPIYDVRITTGEFNEKLSAHLLLIGCVTRFSIMGCEYDGQPPMALEEVVSANYIDMFDSVLKRTYSNASDYSLFTGLGQNNRYQRCLSECADPHAIVARLIRIVKWCNSQDASMSFDDKQMLLPVLNGICKPKDTWKVLPKTQTICEHLFGPAWWDIYRPDQILELDPGENAPNGPWEEWDFHYFSVHELVRDTRPPFLPGIIANRSPVTVALPDLF